MSNKPLMNSLPDSTALDEALVKKISKTLAAALNERGEASLAVSGGSTPKGMLTRLASEPLDWSRIHVLLVDERWLATDHDDSNENMLRQTLLKGEAAHCQYLSLKTDDELAKDGQFTVEEILEELPWPLDVVHLGMGSDGHTASWFHDAPEYQTLQNISKQRCLAVHPNSAPYPRLSLSPAAVFDSRHVFIQLTGKTKRELLEQALFKGADYPISIVLHQDKVPVEIYWAP
ncbi:6-phosphogluconolactonase [Spongiibacter sp. IMCC21906]|uniref:6-phosphogluconolactonase n=1 Tax=Spongiibacter sp. IMCC21906 TaxID=1620392 RepID=UPI00062E0702|nr:6-phosphogluconolactonase [Spongiibacter sp. IMCC21906]AKH69212.1 6-phosphogluconolactonase [Spongiibacter sp. IMCC21906]